MRSIDFSFHDLKFSYFLKSRIFYLAILSGSELFRNLICSIWKVKGHRYCFLNFGILECVFLHIWNVGVKVQRVPLHFFSTICWNKQPLFNKNIECRSR